MILFEKDWGYYPTATPQWETKNESFLRLVDVYSALGVRNAYFPLALLTPELHGIDPHDPGLDIQTKAMVLNECIHNFWYFAREVCRIPPRSGIVPHKFKAGRGNIAMSWLFFNHIDSSLTQPRQTGKTTGANVVSEYLTVLKLRNSVINLLTKDDTLRTNTIKDLKSMRLYLPSYLRMEQSDDSDNTIIFECKKWANRYLTAVSQNSEGGALKLGRGLTSAVKHIDEGPFIEYMDIALPALLSSGNAARLEAKAAGAPYGNMFTTTAGKKDTRSGAYMYKLIHGGIPWAEALLDCKDEAELHDVVRKGTSGNKPMVNITLSHRQLGLTDEWLYEAMQETDSTGDAANRDYFNIWTSGGLSSPLDVSILDAIHSSAREPNYTQIFENGYSIRWYIDKVDIATYMRSNKIVIGMDTSEGIGRDSITQVWLNDQTMDVVAVSNVNETNLIRYSEWVVKLLEMFENTTLIPERKSSGQTIIDMLLIRLPAKGIDPFRRIYNQIVDNAELHREEYKIVQQDLARRPNHFYDRYKKLFGFATAGGGHQSRDALYGASLQRAAALGCTKCYDKLLVEEVTGLEARNGRIDHKAGEHDDIAIAWLLATWFLTQSKNLGFYGHQFVLSKANEFRPQQGHVTKEITVMDEYEEYRQQTIRREIDELLHDLRDTKDDVIAQMIECRIRTLDGRLVESYNEVATVDALIQDAVGQRNRTIRDRMRERNVQNTLRQRF